MRNHFILFYLDHFYTAKRKTTLRTGATPQGCDRKLWPSYTSQCLPTAPEHLPLTHRILLKPVSQLGEPGDALFGFYKREVEGKDPKAGVISSRERRRRDSLVPGKQDGGRPDGGVTIEREKDPPRQAPQLQRKELPHTSLAPEGAWSAPTLSQIHFWF